MKPTKKVAVSLTLALSFTFCATAVTGYAFDDQGEIYDDLDVVEEGREHEEVREGAQRRQEELQLRQEMLQLRQEMHQLRQDMHQLRQESTYGERDVRFANGSTLLVSLKGPRTVCAGVCSSRHDCVSFNHHGVTSECRLLNTWQYLYGDRPLVPEPGWSYYVQIPPSRPAEGASCSSGKLLPYDQPAYLRFDFNIKGYTCTNHWWVVKQHEEGFTDCRMVLDYDVDFLGLDVAQYYNKPVNYHTAFDHCLEHSCVGMICFKQTGVPFRCFLKKHTHLTQDVTVRTPDSRLVYWYANCTRPRH